VIGDGLTPYDSDGEIWEFAWIPWVGVIDDAGKAQKVPVRKEWQLTLRGEWQVPDLYIDRSKLNDDPNVFSKYKSQIRPGRGRWKPDWQEGWVCNQRTGLWVVDIDNPEVFRRRMEELGIEVPKTRAQSTGRVGGGMHLLLDGRDLPEQYWRQGGLGNPVWGDLKANGYVAAQGTRHPRGPVYKWLLDSDNVLVKSSLAFADAIMAERALWKETLKDQNRGGSTAGRHSAASITGSGRNNLLISLRGTLFNLGYSDDEIREMLIARNEQFTEPLPMAEMESSVLKPKPNFVRHRVNRHVLIPRLRVAPPEELDTYADGIIKQALTPAKEVAGPAWPDDPKAEDAVWGDLSPAMGEVESAAEILGGLGDLDLIDFGAAAKILRAEVLPDEYTSTLTDHSALNDKFDMHFKNGWNKGARAGHDVPAELRAALDAWHPPCPLPREEIEAHRLPAPLGRWPVRNFVSKTDDRGNARRLVDHFGDLIRFADDQSSLSAYAHDGLRWLDGRSGGPGLAGEYADKMIEKLAVTEAMSLSVEVESLDKDDHPVSNRGQYWGWLNAQQSTAKRAAMLAAAATIEGMRVPVSVFDADTQWLNTTTGELNLGQAVIGTDGEWRITEPVEFHEGKHYPEHFHSRVTAVAYDPAATCPTWEQSLKAWLGDDELIAFLGKLTAASLRGLVIVKTIPVLLGGGDSGKSTFLETIMGSLGTYATAAAPSILRKGKGGGTLTDDVADLRGYRFVSTTETARSEEMDEAKVKRLSGGDRQRARGLYQSSAEFDMQSLLWYATNAMSRLSSEDLALWGRFAPVVFPGMWTASGLTPDGKECNRADPGLKTRLAAEGSGILNWILKHLELLYTEGLIEPAVVTVKRDELRQQQDTVGMFLADSVAAGSAVPDAWDPLLTANPAEYDRTVRLTQAYQHYKAWRGTSATRSAASRSG
jgi:putative DNA primase/helicase